MKLRHGALVLSVLVCAGLVLAAYAQKPGGILSSSAPTKGEARADDAQLIRARANWFFQQRAYPLSHIPAFAREKAWDSFRQMQGAQQQNLLQKYGTNYKQQLAALAVTTSAPNLTAAWSFIGPQPTNSYLYQPTVSGRVTALVVDPCDPSGDTVFLGGANGGLWKSTDAGQHWVPLTDQAPSLAVGSIAIPPASAGCTGSSSNTVYVGTGEGNFSYDSYYGAGVFTCKTSDGSNYSCTPDKTLGLFNNQTNPLSQDYGGPFIGALAVDPQNPSILLAAVQAYGSALNSGIYCSADGGSTWNHILPAAGVTGVVGTDVAFDQAGYGYAALGNLDGSGSLNGVFKSETAFSSNCSPAFSALNNLTNAAGGVAHIGRVSISVLSNSSTPSDQTKDEVFAAIANASDISSTLNGVFKSTDGGSTWTTLTDTHVTNSGGFCNEQCFYDMTITIDPHNADVIYAGGSAPNSGINGEGNTIIASTDGGTTWFDIGDNAFSLCSSTNPTGCLAGVHVDGHAIAFKTDGSLVYVGTDGGVWSASNPETLNTRSAWNNLNETLGLTQFYAGLSSNPAGWQYRTFGGAQDNGTQVYGQQTGTAWDDTLSCGDGGITLVDPLIPSTVYAECAYIPNFLLGIEKSLLNGSVTVSSGNITFNEASTGINGSDRGNFIPAFAIDPEATGTTGGIPDAQTLYFGTYRVWQTTDGAATWKAISQDVTGASAVPFCNTYPDSCVLTSLAVAPTDSNEVVAGSFVGHVSVSTDAMSGSPAWTDVSGSLPGRTVTQVAVDPANQNTLYATFSGFSSCTGCDGKGHVFMGSLATTSGTPSVTWTDISAGAACTSPAGDLPDVPVNAIVVDPDQPGQLFVATDVGVMMGTLVGAPVSGACWQPLGTGLPNSVVLSLNLVRASRTLIAGTHGRSAWVLQLGGVQPFHLSSISPASVDAPGTQFTMTLNGTGFTSSSTVNWTPQGSTATSLSQTSSSGCAIPTCIAVSVPASLLASGNLVQVSVFDPTQTPTSTNPLPFSIVSTAPTLSTVSPATATAPASADLTINATGTNFVTGSSGTQLGLSQLAPLPSSCFTTNVASSTSLSASVLASCLQYGGVFFVTATNPPPGGGSSNPNLIAAPSPVGGGCNNDSTPGCLLAVTGPAPGNDSFSSAQAISSLPFSPQPEDTSGVASNGPGIPSSCTTGAAGTANGNANSVWFKYTPSANTTVDIDTIGSAYDTILSVWVGPSVSTLQNVACNDDIVAGSSRASQITGLGLSANTTYYIMVSAYGIPIYDANGNFLNIIPDGGKTVLNVTGSTQTPPTFTASSSTPNPSTIAAGSSTSFTLTLTPQPGSASGSVSIQPCTTSPSESTVTCSYSPSTLTLGSSPVTSTVTVRTVSRGAIPPANPFQAPPLGWIVAVLGVASMLMFLLQRRMAGSRVANVRSGLAAALGFALLAGVLLFSGACGGGGGGAVPTTGTPSGTYTVTVPTSPAPASGGNASVQVTVQ